MLLPCCAAPRLNKRLMADLEPQNCQGNVIRILREEIAYVTIEIKWDKEYFRERDREVSRDKLLSSKWNSN